MHFFLKSLKKKTKKIQGLKNLIVISSAVCVIYLISSLFVVPKSKSLHSSDSLQDISSSTSLEHIVFGIASNDHNWPRRKDYVRVWWRHNLRGCVFLETMPANVTSNPNDENTLPPVCVSGDTSTFRYTYRGGLRSAIRVARVVLETFALNHTDVRWFVFGDDDTFFFPENLVKVLSKYDHGLWYYIGSNSESYVQNTLFSFDMAFGGAGFAISYPLVKVLAEVFDSCIERYPHLYGSDGRIFSCIAEFGISLTHEPGFHQMDIRGDVSGLLAAHPLTPLLSLHHLELVNPIFPNMPAINALEHLNEAVKYDPHRIVQQTVCYDRWFSWTISVSWGYAVQVFGRHVPLSDTLRVQQTFEPYQVRSHIHTLFNFDTREHHPDQCQRPTVFFMDKVYSNREGIKSTYRKMVPDNCTRNAGSPWKLDEIVVTSQKFDPSIKQLHALRRQCCDVQPSKNGEVMEISIRECGEEELIYMH